MIMKKGFIVAVCVLWAVGLWDAWASGGEKPEMSVRGEMHVSVEMERGEVMGWDSGGEGKGEKGGEDAGLVVMFWNLENFFDWEDEGKGESDGEFSSYGSRHWTRKRFYGKCDAIAKSVLWVGDEYGRMPDVIGVAEVENKGVLTKMLNATALRKYDYSVVHYESGDRRGIDVALLYRRSSLELVSSSVRTPVYEGEKMATRDILHARMRLADGSEVDFIVNHHPSKFGGEEESRGRRAAAMTALKEMCDSLGNGRIVAMGDFNDVPSAASFSVIEGTLVNKGMELHERGEGTIRYEGEWDLIDMFMVSGALEGRTAMEVCRVPFLMTWEKKHPGEKPLRTYSGPRYIGGVSDHCPIVLLLD